MSYTLEFIGVMVAMCVADICWAQYFMKIEERKSISAGLWAVGIYLCGAITVSAYVEDKSFILAAIVGSFLGTYFIIENKKKIEKKNKDGIKGT